MTRTWRVAVWAIVSLVLALGGFVLFRYRQWRREPPPLVPSRETTFLTGPAHADGTIDYADLWEAEVTAGVTPENNAAPLLLAAIGMSLSRFTPEQRAAAPTLDHPFVEEVDWIEQHGDAFGRSLEIDEEPFDAVRNALESGEEAIDDLPAFERWLAENREVLDLAVEASKRDRFLGPIDGTPLIQGGNWSVGLLVRGLTDRARVAALEKDRSAVLRDLGAAFAIGRLEEHSDHFIDWTRAESDLTCAWKGLAAIAGNDALTQQDVATFLASFRMTSFESRLRGALRLNRIELLVLTNEFFRRETEFQDPNLLLGLEMGLIPQEAAARLRAKQAAEIRRVKDTLRRLDRNVIYRRINGWCDRAEAALTSDDSWIARLQEMERLQEEAQRGVPSPWMPEFLLGPERVATALGDMVATTSLAALRRMVASALECTLESDRAVAQLAAQSFAIAMGRDPASTDDLTPAIFATPFRDRATDSSLRFRRDEHGALVADGPAVEVRRELEAWESKKRR